MTSRRADTPWPRSSAASRAVATASQVAPPLRAASAAGTAPCPYASAFTTAHRAVPASSSERIRRQLRSTAP